MQRGHAFRCETKFPPATQDEAAAVTTGLIGKAQAAAMGPVLAVISHPVKDYAAWRIIYDSAEPLRQKVYGCRSVP